MKEYNLYKLIFTLTMIFSAAFLSFCEEDEFYTRKRTEMVRRQLMTRDITDRQVLEVMGKVPRHLFVSSSLRRQAYVDSALPIDEGQTISQPLLANLTDKVYSLEIRENLAKKAAETLSALDYNQVQVKWSDGYFGWEEHAPFDAIIITCAANHVPPPLLKQLKEGGRLILPLGSTLYFQTLTLITKKKGKPKVKSGCQHQDKIIPSPEGNDQREN
jgi:protein-L-isoaspartate(D-aspartate) O-methyltransferase